MIIVDSSVWVDFYNGAVTRESEYLDSILGIVPLAVGDVILAEVLQGFREDRHHRRALELFDDLTFVEMLGRERALAAADKFRRLRRMGITISKTVDMIIGSYCIDEKVPLLFSDKDFQRMVQHGGLRSALPSTRN